MRSTSRLLEEHPDEYAKTVIQYGTPASTAERIVAVKGTVQLQPVAYTGVNEALAGRTGVALAPDYTNSNSLVAYAPLEIEGLDWVIVAHIDAAEAFAPVTAFTRGVLLSLLGIVLVVSLLSLLLAQVFTRPINRLVAAVRRVAGGDLAVEVPQGSRDEIGDLGTAFNDMAVEPAGQAGADRDPDAGEREADAHPDAGVDGQALQGGRGVHLRAARQRGGGVRRARRVRRLRPQALR